MPKIVTTVQGSGGGVKTRLVNLVDVSKALKVKPDYPLTFIGIELGTQIEYREGEGTCLINGKNEQKVIEDKLFKFIDKYVLCPFCKLPEIIIQIKNKEVRSKCKACGKKSKLDNTHKFVKHIIKNPPSAEEDVKTIEDSKEAGKTTGESNVSTQPKPLDKSVKEKIKSLLGESDKVIKSSKDPNAVAEELLKLYGDIETDKKYYVLIHALFDCNIFKYFKSKAPIIKKIIENDPKKSEAAYHIVVAIIDLTLKRFSKEHFNTITKHIPSILWVLYDEDIINEDWYFRFLKGNIKVNNIFVDRDSMDQFIKFSEEFTKWLETAQYEGEVQGKVESEKPTNKKQMVDIDNI